MINEDKLTPEMQFLVRTIRKGDYGKYYINHHRNSYSLHIRIVDSNENACKEKMRAFRKRTKNFVVSQYWGVKRKGRSFCGAFQYLVYKHPKYRKEHIPVYEESDVVAKNIPLPEDKRIDSEVEKIVDGVSSKIGIEINLLPCDTGRKGEWHSLSFNYNGKSNEEISRIREKANKVITSSEYYAPSLSAHLTEYTKYYIGTSRTGKIEIHYQR